jgi:DNA invertase Pin-like site-specific DNA recombinase
MKIGIYARVSTKEQTSENQVRELTAIAEKMGAAEIVVFSDNGISGAKGREARKGLDELMKAATRREIDKVLVWSVDRLGRSLSGLVETLGDLQGTGAELYFHKQAIDTGTASGRALFGMLSVFSEFEREMIRERVNAGLARAKANGVVLGRRNTTDHLAKQVLGMRGSGKTFRDIAKALEISTYTAHRLSQLSTG